MSATSNPPGYYFPEATAIIPSGGSVAINTSAVITFNLPINLPVPCNSITVSSSSLGALTEGTHYSLALGGGNTTVVITFTGTYSPIPDNDTVTINIVPNITALSGGITDTANGITIPNALSESFTVGTTWDSTAPNIVGGTNYPTTPPVTVFLTQATRMAQATPQEIHAQFNEDIDPTSVTTDTFYLTRPGPVTVPASVTYIAGTRYAILTPSVYLDPSTTYTVHVREDIRDLAGNTLGPGTADFTTWTFDTTASLAELDITPGVGPTLSDLFVDSVSTADADISWMTDEPTYYTLTYGRNSAPATAIGPSAAATTFATETAAALSANARYWFNVGFTDIEGLAGTNTGNYQFNTESNDGATYIDSAAGNQSSPKTIPYHPTGGGATGCYLFWNDSDAPTTYAHIYGQLFNNALAAQWTAPRRALFTEPAQTYTYQSAVEDGTGNVVVMAQRSTGGHMYAKRLDTGGAIAWGYAATDPGLDIRSVPTAALSSMYAAPVAVGGAVQTIRSAGTMTGNIPANPVYDFTALADLMTGIVDGDVIVLPTGPANGTTVTVSSNFRHVIGQAAALVAIGNSFRIGDASYSVSGTASHHYDIWASWNYASGGTLVVTDHNFNLNGLGDTDIIVKNSTSDYGIITGVPAFFDPSFINPCVVHTNEDIFYRITVNWSINIVDGDNYTIYNYLTSGTAETPPAHPLYDNTADFLGGTAVADSDIVLNYTDLTDMSTVNTGTFAARTRALDLDADIMTDGDLYSIIRFQNPSGGTGNIVTFGLADAGAASHLEDAANGFGAVQTGDVAYNITDSQYAVITATAAGDLTLSRDASFSLNDRYVIIHYPRSILYTWEENGSVWGRIMTADAGTAAPPLPDEIRAPWAIATGTSPRLIPDASGNAILVYRGASGGIQAARLNGWGAITNTADIDAQGSFLPETIIDVKSDGAGGVVILYNYSNGALHAQRVAGTSATWALQWGANGYTIHDETVVTDDEVMIIYPTAPNDIGVAATVISAGNYDIWSCRVGTVNWGPFNYTGASTQRQEKPQIYFTAASIILVWDDYRFFNRSYIDTGYGVFGLKISTADGTAASAPAPLWRTNSGGIDEFGGVSIILNRYNEYPGVPLVVPYNNGADSILVWTDYRAGLNADLKYIDLDAFVPTP